MTRTSPSRRRLRRLHAHLAPGGLGRSPPRGPPRSLQNFAAGARSDFDSSAETMLRPPLATPTAIALDACAEIDRLEDAGEHEAALRAIRAASENARRGNASQLARAALLWRAARAHERLWQASRPGSARQAEHLRKGLGSAKGALGCISKVNKKKKETGCNAEGTDGNTSQPTLETMERTTGKVHKWMAVYLGMEANAGGVTASARNAAAINMHTRAALDRLPDDATLHHMLGRLCFSCAGASWAEKAAAKVVGFKVPEATFLEAAAHFRRAEKLAPTAANRLWVGKSYLAIRPRDKRSTRLARKWLTRAAKTDCTTAEDRNAQGEARRELVGL